MKALSRLMPLVCLLIAAPAFALNAMDWNAAGCTGVVVPGSAAHTCVGPSIGFAATATGTITVRYPVVNTWGSAISKTPPWSRLEIGGTPNGGAITGSLIRVTECSSTTLGLCTIPSVTFCDTCSFSTGINFASFVYYVEVKLSRTTTAQNPLVHTVSVF